MFIRATSFNQPLNNWNVSKEVTYMGLMFWNATSFDRMFFQLVFKLLALARRAPESFHRDARVPVSAASEAAPRRRHRALQFVVAHASASAQRIDAQRLGYVTNHALRQALPGRGRIAGHLWSIALLLWADQQLWGSVWRR